MKIVTFWEAMKARAEGKWIRSRLDQDKPWGDWISPSETNQFFHERPDWQIREEPREWKFALYSDGSISLHHETYQGLNVPIEIIKVREVIE